METLNIKKEIDDKNSEHISQTLNIFLADKKVKLEPVDDYESDYTDYSAAPPNVCFIKDENIDIIDEDLELNSCESSITDGSISNKQQKIQSLKSSDKNINDDDERLLLPKRYQCKYCFKTYFSKSRSDSHTKLECKKNPNNITKYYCQKCQKKFASKFSYDRHTYFSHLNPNALRCKICKQKFEVKEQFEKHLSDMPCRKSFAGPCFCFQCGRKYRTRSGLVRHLKLECGITPKFSCAHCEHRTSQKTNLIKHLSRVHNIPKEMLRAVCNICKKSYKNECSLRRHMELECGQKKRFNCKFCLYSTKRKFSLKIHLNKRHKEILTNDMLS